MATRWPVSLHPAFGAGYSRSSQKPLKSSMWTWVQKEPLLRQPVAKAGDGSFRSLHGLLDTCHRIEKQHLVAQPLLAMPIGRRIFLSS